LTGLLNWLAAKMFAQVSPVGDKAASSDASRITAEVSAPGLRIGLSSQGHILRMKLGPDQISVPVRLCTTLRDSQAEGTTYQGSLEGGGFEFSRVCIHAPSGERCRVTERFLPSATSVRWEVEILGEGRPWSTAVETELAWLDARDVRVWTGWSQSGEESNDWADPLTFSKVSNATLRYGDSADGQLNGKNSFSVPIVTLAELQRDLALSFVQSPEDTLLDMELRTTELGDAILSRFNHRISNTSPIRFAMDLVAHSADWRAGLGWMVSRYPQFFEPVNHRAYELDSCGAYSGYHGKLDVQALAEMAFGVNWNASFDWPFQGLNIPLVNAGVEWQSWYQKQTSIAQMQAFDQETKSRGFHALDYFVTTEGGNYIQETAPPRKAVDDADLWRDPNDFIHYQIPGAVLRDESERIRYSNWFNNVVLDPGEPVWQDLLLKQAHHMVAKLPASDGICIDRMDWLTAYNPHRDDGVSWKNGKAARSFLISWNEALSRLAPIFHDAGKCIFVNCLLRRVDVLQHIDGLFTEFGDSPSVLNLAAVLGSQRPVIAWTNSINSLRPDPDAYFQRRLHLGVFPMAPYPDADHSIAPDPWAEAEYGAYGQMFNAIRGKRWVLRANVVSCEGSNAKVNLFCIPGGFAAPVTFGSEDTADILCEVPLEVTTKDCVVQVLHPGTTEWVELDASTPSDRKLHLRVPLKRGCALVRAVYAWITPDIATFKSGGEVRIHCTMPNAVAYYTLDASDPGTSSAKYGGPIKINETAELKAAIFVEGKQIGRTLFRQIYVV
jgi:hypothetical protein